MYFHLLFQLRIIFLSFCEVKRLMKYKFDFMKFHEPLLPGKVYHMFNHSVGQELLFMNSANYYFFLKRYEYYLGPLVETYAYCLLPNHFHLLIKLKTEDEIARWFEVRHANKVESQMDCSKFVMQEFSNFFNSYAKTFNKMHQRRGALFCDYVMREKGSEMKKFKNLVVHIHNNPVHHGYCDQASEWKWTSYESYFSERKSRLSRLKVFRAFNGRRGFEDEMKNNSIKSDMSFEFEWD